MPNGFCPDLLYHINEIAGENAPGRKMHVAGFLSMLFCCQNSSASPVNDPFEGGHIRDLRIKYRRRPVLSDTSTEASCDINIEPAYQEWNLPALKYRQHSFHIPDDLIRQYCQDASRMRTVGAPPTRVMQEVYETILEGANIVMKGVNVDLVTAMATEFGVNTTTSDDGGKLININQDGNKLILDNGIVEMMQDFTENEFCGEPCIVGGGIYANYDKAAALACCNAAGLDMSRVSTPRFFFDKDTQNIWGANTIGAFAPGSVKFFGFNKYAGNWAGDRGTSVFTTLPLPVIEFGCVDDCLRDLIFDLQLKYYDCPTDVEGGGTIQPGWQAIISKTFGLWVQPTDAYAATDELYQTNGTLKYFITNSTYSGGAYGIY